jgi:hypothetical protein
VDQDRPIAWWKSLARSAREEPGKAALLGALIVVLLVLWARVASDATPRPARASVAAKPTPARARSVVPPAAAPAPAVANVWQDWVASPINPLARNLFAIDWTCFPQDTSQSPAPTSQPAADAASDSEDPLAKSQAIRADQENKRRVLLDYLRQQAGQLRLHSILVGAQPKALINDELVREGDVVASFRVLKIEPRRVIIEREGIRLEVQMN